MLEFYYNFLTRLCDVNNFGELELDTDSLYLALAEEDCIRPEIKTDWEQLRSKDCCDSFTAGASGNFFLQMCCNKHKKNTTRKNQDFSKKSSDVKICYVANCWYHVVWNNFQFKYKTLKKRVQEKSSDGPLDKYRRVLDEKLLLRQQTEASARKVTMLLRMS